LTGIESIFNLFKKVFLKIESLAPIKCGNSIQDKFYTSNIILILAVCRDWHNLAGATEQQGLEIVILLK